MNNNENCLLIGNGLNRCLKNSISWGELLNGIAHDLGVHYYSDISMPLEFERIVNEYQELFPYSKENIYDKVKTQIAEKVCNVQLPKDAIHRRLEMLPLDAFMTTNYDYLLEMVFNEGFKALKGNKKYLFERTSIQAGREFYHLHGIASHKQSLCLGYEHYMGVVYHLRNDLNRNENKTGDKQRGMIIKQILYGDKERTNTWGERFYTSNIGILGLELSECESDLWWLITHRAYLYHSNYQGLRERITNKIVFYDIIDGIEKKDAKEEQRRLSILRGKENKHHLLKSDNVIVRQYYLGKEYYSYEEAYHAILDDIEKNGVS